jgi:hypothetical protein
MIHEARSRELRRVEGDILFRLIYNSTHVSPNSSVHYISSKSIELRGCLIACLRGICAKCHNNNIAAYSSHYCYAAVVVAAVAKLRFFP